MRTLPHLQVFREDGLLSFDAATQVYGMDWFEGAIARPGLVLKDVVRAVQPQLAEQARGSGGKGSGEGLQG